MWKLSEAYCVWFAFCRECDSHTLDIGSHLQVSRCYLHRNLITRTRNQNTRSVYTEQATLALNNQFGLFHKYEAAKDTKSELSCYSTWFLVRSWLFWIQHLPCMLEGSVEVPTKNILYRSIENKTHFPMPRGTKMSLNINEPKQIAPHSISNTISEHALRTERNDWICLWNNQWKIVKDQLPTRGPLQWQDNSIISEKFPEKSHSASTRLIINVSQYPNP